MAHTPFIVFRDQGQWTIKSNGMHYGPYPTQRDAIRAAVDQFSIEWTYGKDAYPPHSSDFLDAYAKAETSAIGSGVPGEQHLG